MQETSSKYGNRSSTRISKSGSSVAAASRALRDSFGSKAGTRLSKVLKTGLRLLELERNGVVSVCPPPISIPALWTTLVPTYRSVNYGPISFRVHWDPKYAKLIQKISPQRAINRWRNYVAGEELERVIIKLIRKGGASIRFGNVKSGHGYSGERGDFCLVGGSMAGRDLSLYYRSLELIGGFAYDLTLINALATGLFGETYQTLKTVTFHTQKAFVFALKGNSNEKLYPKLQRIFTR